MEVKLLVSFTMTDEEKARMKRYFVCRVSDPIWNKINDLNELIPHFTKGNRNISLRFIGIWGKKKSDVVDGESNKKLGKL